MWGLGSRVQAGLGAVGFRVFTGAARGGGRVDRGSARPRGAPRSAAHYGSAYADGHWAWRSVAISVAKDVE